MPNDIPDWTGQNTVQVVSAAGASLGDPTAAVLAKDSVTETITTTAAYSGGAALLVSFKPAAGLAYALRGVVGAFKVGALTTVSPLFGQATAAGNLLVAWVTSATGAPTTAAAGWVQSATSGSQNGQFATVWNKPNCGAGEAAPTFTCAGGTSEMLAQLAEFTGGALAAPTEQSGSTFTPISPTAFVKITATAADAAFGDLILTATRWVLTSVAAATFSDSYNNGAAAVQAGSGTATTLQRLSNFTFGIVPAAVPSQPIGVAPWAYDVVANLAGAVGAQATVTLAANPTKAYTASAISGSLVATTAAAQRVVLQLLDGATIIYSHLLAVQALINEQKGVTLSGMAYKGTVNTAMTLSLQTPAAGGQESVSLGAYLR